MGLIFLSVPFLFAQEGLPEDFSPEPRGVNGLRIMFYNAENLFDTKDDSLKNDQEFLPGGDRNWNEFRFWEKINNLSSVIVSVGGWEPPAMVGLCEVENRNVLNALFYGSGLKKFNYQIVHIESPDIRGIDVALAYQPKKLTLISKRAIEVDLSDLGSRPTRDILYVKLKTLSEDTLHVFVNHWPSRWGGEEASRPKRNAAARVLRQTIDSLQNKSGDQYIIIMGDFNDGPDNESIYDVLSARDSSSQNYLVNLMYPYLKTGEGTYFYKEATGSEWHLLDQIIVSRPVITPGGLHTKSKAGIFDAEFLMSQEKGIKKPFRTFLGFKFVGGYSDHLPVYIDVFSEEN